MNLREILADIHALEEDLLEFERKYGLRSDTFYAAYAAGEEPDDEAWVLDFCEWASVYPHVAGETGPVPQCNGAAVRRFVTGAAMAAHDVNRGQKRVERGPREAIERSFGVERGPFEVG